MFLPLGECNNLQACILFTYSGRSTICPLDDDDDDDDDDDVDEEEEEGEGGGDDDDNGDDGGGGGSGGGDGGGSDGDDGGGGSGDDDDRLPFQCSFILVNAATCEHVGLSFTYSPPEHNLSSG